MQLFLLSSSQLHWPGGRLVWIVPYFAKQRSPIGYHSEVVRYWEVYCGDSHILTQVERVAYDFRGQYPSTPRSGDGSKVIENTLIKCVISSLPGLTTFHVWINSAFVRETWRKWITVWVTCFHISWLAIQQTNVQQTAKDHRGMHYTCFAADIQNKQLICHSTLDRI